MRGDGDRRRMALSAAVLHGSGGAMVIATTVLPAGSTSMAIPIAGTIALAAAVVLTIGRSNLPMATFHLAPDLGTLLIRRADAALYKAKQGGRDCAILAPPAVRWAANPTSRFARRRSTGVGDQQVQG